MATLPAVPEDFPQELAEEAVIDAMPDLASPLFAKKGQASAAPPIDPEAIKPYRRWPLCPPPRAAAAGGCGRSFGRPAGVPTSRPDHRPLFGKHVLVTAGPTHEPIDPVRYIANRSSGKQGLRDCRRGRRARRPGHAGGPGR